MEPSLRHRVRDGDPDAFGVLFDEFARPVHNLAFRLIGSRSEAEEIVSLRFLEAWRLRAGVELETIVPPATAAALYRAAALIPGVTLIGRVTNADGRPGIAVAWTGHGDRYEWIFDPSTLQFIGERDFDLSTGTPVVTGYTAVVQRAFVAKAGQLP